jgi:spore coat protein CotH
MVQDPSTIHEVLGYGLLRDAGVPAPRVTHVELYLNGEYRGLYLNVETVDDQFLRRWFPDDPYGNLYEGTYGGDLSPSQMDQLDLDEVGVDDVTDRSEVEAVSAFLAGPATEAQALELEARFDLEEVLSAMAAEAVFAHWDGYQYSANNYRIYHRPSLDQWSLIPSGLDQTFEDERGLWDGDAAIIAFCLDIPSCRTRYDLKLAELSYRLLALDCPGLVGEVLPLTLPLYERDRYKESSVEQLEQEVEDTLDWCREFPLEVLGRL